MSSSSTHLPAGREPSGGEANDQDSRVGAPPLYPVSLDVAGRRCLVVGGGRVAGRKISGLLACGADVTVVAPSAHEAVALLAEEGVIASVTGPPLDVQLRPYRDGEAAAYRLVLSATGIPEVDEQVHRDAEGAGVWVNSADDPSHCSFVLPAVLRDGPVTVAVSTSGASPALSVWLRDRISTTLGTGLGDLAKLISEARTRVKERDGTTERVDWKGLFDRALVYLEPENRLERFRRALREVLGDLGPSTQPDDDASGAQSGP